MDEIKTIDKEVKSEVVKENIFKEISSTLPFLTVMVIALGLFRQLAYYGNYNLPIKYFLNITEIGLLVSSDILFSVLVFLFLSLYISFLENIKNNKILNTTTDIKVNRTLDNNILLLVLKICCGVTMMILCVSFFIVKEYQSKLEIIGYLIFIAYWYFVITFFKYFKNHLIKTKNLVIHSGVSLLFLLVVFFTSYELNFVEKGKYTGTIIKTVDSSYISTDSSYFIGKTSEYVFIYNKLKKSTTIIPSSKIENIILVSK